MENTEDYFLSKSCKTILLKSINIFISAFPGKIVFGAVLNHNYRQLNHFQFGTFEVFHLYVSLITIIKKFISEKNTEILQSDGIILKFSEDLSYLWFISKTKVKNVEELKIKLILEWKTESIYQITFSFDQLNDLIIGLSETIVPSLCLKNIEKIFFEFISEQPLAEIIDLNTEKCILMLNEFKRRHNVQIDSIDEPNLFDIMIYYKEIIILYKKIKSLINPTDISGNSAIDAILSA